MRTLTLLIAILLVGACNTHTGRNLCEQQCREQNRDYDQVMICAQKCQGDYNPQSYPTKSAD